MSRWLLLIFLTAGSCPLFGQSKAVVDSLEQHLESFKTREKASALYEIVYFYIRGDAQKAKHYYNYTKTFAARADDDIALAYLLMAQGIYCNRNGKLDSSIYFLEKSKRHAIDGKSNHALIRVHAALAYSFIASGKAELGLENLFEGLRIIAENPDREMEFKLRTNIPWAYLELKQYENCIRYGRQNLALMEGTGYDWIMVYSLNNVAVSYGAIGKLDSARYYVERSMIEAKKNNDNQLLANAHFILGTIYSNAEKYDLAIEQYLLARPYRQKVGNPFFIVSDLYTISSLYYKTKEYKKGVAAAQEALQVAEEFDLTLKLEHTYESLAQNYEGLGDFKNASKYYKLLSVTKDSVYKNSSSQAIAEMQTKYETEKKEKVMAIQKSELIAQEARITKTYYVIAGLVISLMMLAVIFVLVRGRLKRKQELFEKEREISIREAQIMASIQSQESERKRFAQDLHDGMGQLISALRLTLAGVNKKTAVEDRIEVVSKGEKILNEMHHEIRSIAFNLMPQTLVQHGLVPALREMSDRINESGKMKMIVSDFDMPDRLSEVEEISLYRVVQEWVNNVLKYSSASVIQVQLIMHDNELNVTMEDNGIGFDPGVLDAGQGNGWKNIKSRMNLLKGVVEVDSRPGLSGTTIILKVPKIASGKSPQKIESTTVSIIQPNAATVAPNTH